MSVDAKIVDVARMVLELQDCNLRTVQSIRMAQHKAMKQGNVYHWSLAPNTAAVLKEKCLKVRDCNASLDEIVDAVSINDVLKAING